MLAQFSFKFDNKYELYKLNKIIHYIFFVSKVLEENFAVSICETPCS